MHRWSKQRPAVRRGKLPTPRYAKATDLSYKNHKLPHETVTNQGKLTMSPPKNRYGLTAARAHTAVGRVRRPSTTTIDVHCHIVVPEAARLAGPHVDPKQIPLAFFADAATREINAMQDADRAQIMYADLDGRLKEMDRMGVDIQVVAPAPGQCYYTLSPALAAQAH